MPKLSLILGTTATLLFTTVWSAMLLLVHGEEDWNLAIILVLCFLAAIGISIIGGALSLVSLFRSPTKRTTAMFGLVLNLIPGLTWLVFRFVSQLRLR